MKRPPWLPQREGSGAPGPNCEVTGLCPTESVFTPAVCPRVTLSSALHAPKVVLRPHPTVESSSPRTVQVLVPDQVDLFPHVPAPSERFSARPDWSQLHALFSTMPQARPVKTRKSLAPGISSTPSSDFTPSVSKSPGSHLEDDAT